MLEIYGINYHSANELHLIRMYCLDMRITISLISPTAVYLKSQEDIDLVCTFLSKQASNL